MDSSQLISFLISWGPTILLILILLFFILLGIIRGFRKSLILAIHALVIFIICIIIFCVLVDKDDLDTSMYQTFNSCCQSFSGNTLNSTLGISDNASSLREVIGLYIIKLDTENSGYGSAVQLIIAENGAYFAALIDMIYRMIFALVLLIPYSIMLFIMYIIYLIFYPERRHKDKVINAFSLGNRKRTYHKKRLLGGVVGLVRGIVASLIVLSFIGLTFYVISGANTETDDIDFGDEELNEYYDLYKCVSDYDKYGVYAVLNSIKDSNDIPYYLYITDLVMSGNATVSDESGENVTASFVVKSDFASCSKFIKNAINLINKYDPEFIKFLISDAHEGESKTDDLVNKLAAIFANEEFQIEFKNLISNFDDNSFLLNFGLSLIDTVAENYDTMIDVEDANTKKILDIVFDKENGIKVSNILTKEDAINLATALIKIIGNSNNLIDDNNSISQSNLLDLALDNSELIVDTLTNLSCFNSETKTTKFNQVFSKIYDLLVNEWVTSETNNAEETNTYTAYSSKLCKLANVESSDVDWADEIKSIIKILPEAAIIYESIDTTNQDTIIDSIFDVFTGDSATKNEEAYDKIVSSLGSSKLIGVLMSTDPIYEKVFGDIEKSIEEQGGTLIIGDISYANTIDSAGNVTNYGETYNLLAAVRVLLKTSATDEDGNTITAKTIYNLITDENGIDSSNDINQMIELLLSEDSKGNSTAYYVAQSTLVRTFISAYISTINLSSDETKKVNIYLGLDDCDVISDSDGNEMKLVHADSLVDVLEGVQIFASEYPTIIDSIFDENSEVDILDELLANDKLDKLKEVLKKSQIIEGTVAAYLVVILDDYDEVELPKGFSDTDDLSGWLSTSSGDGELIKLVTSVQNSGVDLIKIINGNSVSYIFNTVLEDEETVNALLESDLLWIIVSGMVQSFGDDSFNVIVPLSSQEDSGYVNLNNETIYAITKENIVDLAGTIKEIVTINDDDSITINYQAIFEKNDDDNYEILESEILSATIVATLIRNLDNITVNDSKVISIPSNLSTDGAGSDYELKNNTNYDGDFSKNPWSEELPKLLDAIDLLLEISTDNDFDFNDTDALSEKLKTNMSSLSEDSNLKIVYESDVMKSTLTNSLSTLSDGIIVVSNDAIESSGENEGFIKYSELSNMFKLLDGKDIDNFNVSDVELNDDTIDCILNSNTLLATITNYLIDSSDIESIVIPDIADVITEDTIYSHISYSEMEKLFNALLLLGSDSDGDGKNELSINDLNDSDTFSVDTILDFTDEDLDTFLSSNIINYSITQILKDLDSSTLSIVIPQSVFGDSKDIVYSFKDRDSISKSPINTISRETLDSLLGLVDDIMPKDDEGTRNVSIYEVFNHKEDILDNEILHATIINYFATNDDIKNNENIFVPSTLIEAGTKENLEEITDFSSSTNVWISNEELSKLFDALDELFDISHNEDFDIEKVDLGSAISGMNEASTINPTYTKLELCYKSSIIKASIAKNLVSNDDIQIPSGACDTDDIAGTYVKESELKLLFDIIDDITGGSSISDISTDMINDIDFVKVINIINSNSSSLVARSVLSKNIIDNLKDEVSDIKTSLDCYDTEVNYQMGYNSESELITDLGSTIDMLTTKELTNIKNGIKRLSNIKYYDSTYASTTTFSSDYCYIKVADNYIELDSDTTYELGSSTGTHYKGVDGNYYVASNSLFYKPTTDSNESYISQTSFSSEYCYIKTKINGEESYVEINDTTLYSLNSSSTGVYYLGSDGNYYEPSLTVGEISIDDDITISKDDVEIIYLSRVLQRVVTAKMVNADDFKENGVSKIDSACYDNTSYDSTTTYDSSDTDYYEKYISKDEILALVNAVEIITGKDELSIKSLDLSSGYVTSKNITEIIESVIAYRMVCDEIAELAGSSYISTSVYVKTYVTQNKFINVDELVNLISVVGKDEDVSGEYKLSLSDEIDTDSISSDKIQFMTDSLIARARISKTIIANNNVVVPNSLITTTETNVAGENISIIEKTEFNSLLTALSKLDVEKANSENTAKLPVEGDYDDIVASVIMRATITSKIKISSDGSSDSNVYMLNSDINSDYYTNDNVLVLSEDELINIFKALKAVNGDSSSDLELTLDLETIAGWDDDVKDTVLDSNTVRIYISQMLQDEAVTSIIAGKYTLAGKTQPEASSENVYISTTVEETTVINNTNVDTYTKDQITDILDTCYGS